MSDTHLDKQQRLARAVVDALALQDQLSNDAQPDAKHIVALRRKQVIALTGLPSSSLDYAIKNYNFPKSFSLTPGRSAWSLSAVQLWLKDRMENGGSTWPRIETTTHKRRKKPRTAKRDAAVK